MGGEIVCPVPLPAGQRILLAHGGGGRMTRDLVEQLFVPAFRNDVLAALHDSAVLDVPAGRLAFTTDSFVVRPIFFPGGDVGTLAVNGTVNDLAVSGAQPLALSAGFVVEEGFPVADLRRIAASMGAAAQRAGLQVPPTPHQLRHAFASNVLDAGGSVDEAQELLGHASVSSTEIYTHPDPARLRAAVDAVPSPRELAGETR